MLKFMMILLISVLAPNLSAYAQIAMLCRTPKADCASQYDEILPGRPCWCDTAGGPVVGQTEYSSWHPGDASASEDTGRGIGIRASRGFATPDEVPPGDFAAYGVVLFKSLATSFDLQRHKLICEAYLASLPSVAEASVPPSQQMVTIWPIASSEAADELATLPRDAICDVAIRHYSLAYSLDTLERLRSYDATYGRYDLSRAGPFLVAWAPGTKVLDTTSIALFLDLSDVDTWEQAQHEFDLWRTRIQVNPELWRDGFQQESLVSTLREFFDRFGAIIEVVK